MDLDFFIFIYSLVIKNEHPINSSRKWKLVFAICRIKLLVRLNAFQELREREKKMNPASPFQWVCPFAFSLVACICFLHFTFKIEDRKSIKRAWQIGLVGTNTYHRNNKWVLFAVHTHTHTVRITAKLPPPLTMTTTTTTTKTQTDT